MKKRIVLFSLLLCSLFVLTSCGALKKKSPSEINFSMKMPGSFKYLDQEKTLRYVFDDPEVEAVLKKLEGKVCSYADPKNMMDNCVILIQINTSKLEEVKQTKVKDCKDAARVLGISSPYEKVVSIHGSEYVVLPSISATSAITEKDGKVYWIMMSFNIMDDKYDSSAYLEKMGESMKAKSHGFLLGIWDGFKLPVAAIIRIWNPGSRVFATENNGASYIIGFVLGILLLMSVIGGGSKAKS